MSSLRGVAPDSSLVAALEKEVESLQTERREVENWLNQAESWAAHMGQWKAIVGMPPQVCDNKKTKKTLKIPLASGVKKFERNSPYHFDAGLFLFV